MVVIRTMRATTSRATTSRATIRTILSRVRVTMTSRVATTIARVMATRSESRMVRPNLRS